MAYTAGVSLGPYKILSLAGVGGMGEVYKAHDTRLHRIIALKTLRAENVADAGRRRRFLLEAQTASRLNHPNIVTIYDISEENGVCFIAMEYVAGTTLEQANAGHGLPLPRAMKYAGEIADALAAAHSAGIVHRDLKPANIIITESDHVKLLDFGVAKLLDPGVHTTVAGTATLHTQPGTIVGTVAYMSPEQAEGRALDGRSDIFSFGLVLYELFCGQRANPQVEPRPLRDINPAIPAPIERHVNRCLRKNPSERFQTVLALKRALVEAYSSVVSKDETASIAVLPFMNLSADKENQHFSDGLVEEIINALTKLPNLRVIARTSAFALRGKEQDLRTIGEKLRVETLLDGSVRRAGNRIRVTAQLIRVADESYLWSERYDRKMTNAFTLQDDVSQSIAEALKNKFANTPQNGDCLPFPPVELARCPRLAQGAIGFN